MAKKQPMGPFDVEVDNHPYGDVSSSKGEKNKVKHVTDDYDAKDHLNTIAQAHAILSDPKKMAKVQKLTKFHKQAVKHSIKSLDDVKSYTQDAYGAHGKGPMPVDHGEDD